MSVGLSFKNNVKICFTMIGEMHPVEQVIYEIQNVKRNDEQFELLAVMDALVIHNHRIVFHFFIPKQYEWIQSHCLHMKIPVNNDG